MSDDTTVYGLAHPDGERWLYYLPPAKGFYQAPQEMLADGVAMTPLRKNQNWWVADHQAEHIAATYSVPSKRIGYTLTVADALSVHYPSTLTVEEFDERAEREGDPLYALYGVVREDQPDQGYVYEGPYVLLDGREPPGPGEPPWVTKLPYVLAERSEYAHLFPGHIPGLVAHMEAIFKAMPRVEHVFQNFQHVPGTYVSLRVPYDPPRTVFKPDLSRRTSKPLRTGRHVPEVVARKLTLPIPDRVTGDTYAEALAAWDAAVAFWTEQVTSVDVAACSHCDGTGYANVGALKYGQ